ncbi:hypothetical protein ACFQH2_15255 [Natronoarchaeum sp. GCM10025703]|uniref:hypothetical protein n=1 Tax=Natronoarchaeum sp. GCM10025703 TaxID=3252685 RepID=UPI0036170711
MAQSTDRQTDEGRGTSRRALLGALGGAVGLPLGTGASAYAADRRFTDEDSDGIPDDKERSEAFNDRLEALFGADQFERVDPARPDLLLDVRYVEGTSIDWRTKQSIETRFRERGIHAQWLDYPREYDSERFEERYGWNVKSVLWERDGFYHEEVEPFVRDVAIQLVVVPGHDGEEYAGQCTAPGRSYSGAASMATSTASASATGRSSGSAMIVGNRNASSFTRSLTSPCVTTTIRPIPA